MQDLPLEILSLISSHLFWFHDRVAFRSTCSRIAQAMRTYPLKRDIEMNIPVDHPTMGPGSMQWHGRYTWGYRDIDHKGDYSFHVEHFALFHLEFDWDGHTEFFLDERRASIMFGKPEFRDYTGELLQVKELYEKNKE